MSETATARKGAKVQPETARPTSSTRVYRDTLDKLSALARLGPPGATGRKKGVHELIDEMISKPLNERFTALMASLNK